MTSDPSESCVFCVRWIQPSEQEPGLATMLVTIYEFWHRETVYQ